MKIKEIIVVEGKDDTTAIKRALNADFGYHIVDQLPAEFLSLLNQKCSRLPSVSKFTVVISLRYQKKVT